MRGRSNNSVRTTERSFDVIEALQRLDGARLTELADELGLPNSTVHNHLTTLENRGYVVKQGHQYHIGLRFLDHSEYARRTRKGFTVSHKELNALSTETNETAVLLTEENGMGIVLYSVQGAGAAPLDLRPGKRIQLHTSGIGRAYLAYLSNNRIEEIFSEYERPRQAEQTFDDTSDLLDRLERVRQRGYAYDLGGQHPSVASVGTALKDENGNIVASIGVAGANSPFSEDRIEELVGHVQTTANIIELHIAHS